jgi:hypothetical protein
LLNGIDRFAPIDEVGDKTNRDAIRHAARTFAEELMLLMLEQDYQ